MRITDTRDRIRKFLLERQAMGEPPTVREIGDALGLKSPATVYQHLKKLEQEGIIVSTGAGRSRGWRFTDPTEVLQATGDTIPVVGRIAAGEPVDSLLDALPPLPISPVAFAGRSSKIVALRVEGDSHSELGLLDGDFAIVQRQPRVENGDVAIVHIDGEGALRRWRGVGTRASLHAANRRFKAISRRAGLPVEIIGKLVGVVRFH